MISIHLTWKTHNNVHVIGNLNVQGAKRRDLRFLNLELSPSLRSDEQYKEEVHLEVQFQLFFPNQTITPHNVHLNVKGFAKRVSFGHKC